MIKKNDNFNKNIKIIDCMFNIFAQKLTKKCKQFVAKTINKTAENVLLLN